MRHDFALKLYVYLQHRALGNLIEDRPNRHSFNYIPDGSGRLFLGDDEQVLTCVTLDDLPTVNFWTCQGSRRADVIPSQRLNFFQMTFVGFDTNEQRIPMSPKSSYRFRLTFVSHKNPTLLCTTMINVEFLEGSVDEVEIQFTVNDLSVGGKARDLHLHDFDPFFRLRSEVLSWAFFNLPTLQYTFKPYK